VTLHDRLINGVPLTAAEVAGLARVLRAATNVAEADHYDVPWRYTKRLRNALAALNLVPHQR
jgi:hypothetical protein